MLWRNSSRPILAASVSSVEPPTYKSWSGLVNVQKFRTNADTLSNLRSSFTKAAASVAADNDCDVSSIPNEMGPHPLHFACERTVSNKVLVWDMKIMKTMQLIEFWATFLVAD